jgi:LuxR family maltose regulon positive regulatory protein
MKESVLSTKLHQPQCRPGVVLRPRLMSKLDSGLYSRFILISAPAGFGKTSLLSQWLSRQRRSAAWISLDRGDNDPVRFLRYLIAAVQSISAGAGQNADILLSSTQPGLPEIEPVLALLINELDKSGEQIIIVFDDYHEMNLVYHAVSFY